MYKLLMVRGVKNEAKFFSLVSSDRTRSNWYKLKQEILTKQKNIFFTVVEHWNRLLREAVESPSLEIPKTSLDTAQATWRCSKTCRGLQ